MPGESIEVVKVGAARNVAGDNGGFPGGRVASCSKPSTPSAVKRPAVKATGSGKTPGTVTPGTVTPGGSRHQ